jgi:hypothetical protein
VSLIKGKEALYTLFAICVQQFYEIREHAILDKCWKYFLLSIILEDRQSGLVVRASDCRLRDPGSIIGGTRFPEM